MRSKSFRIRRCEGPGACLQTIRQASVRGACYVSIARMSSHGRKVRGNVGRQQQCARVTKLRWPPSRRYAHWRHHPHEVAVLARMMVEYGCGWRLLNSLLDHIGKVRHSLMQDQRQLPGWETVRVHCDAAFYIQPWGRRAGALP